MSREKESKLPHHVKFLISGIAGCGSIVVLHPLDLVKSRMQVSGIGERSKRETSLHATVDIIKREGLFGLYGGFSANIARQLCYTMTRLGMYQVIMEHLDRMSSRGLKAQVISSATAGLVASFIATPTDVVLVRMTVDQKLPASQRWNYKHVMDALVRIKREEGFRALWIGALPTVLRATVGTVTQIVPYVQTKNFLLRTERMKNGVGLHFVSSLISGLVYTICSLPLDVAKTRIQNMKKINGKPEYSGMLDVYVKLLKYEGFFSLWKGFTPAYLKIAPNTVLLFLLSERLLFLYKKYILDDSEARGGY